MINPWKNSWTIRLVAAIDIAFGCLLVSIYLQKLFAPVYHENFYNEMPRVLSLKLFLLGPIIFNSFQIVMSFSLFSAAKRGNEPVISYAKANTWFQFSTVMIMFLVLKLLLVLWFPPHGSISRRDIFGATLIVLETFFKIFGLFIVKEFIDDLHALLSMFPSPQFYCIYSPPPPGVPPTIINSTTTPHSYIAYQNSNAYPPSCPPQAHNPPTPAQITPTVSSPPQQQQNRNSTIITV